MYPLDLRETNLLRHALRYDGSDRALTLLGSMPPEGALDRGLQGLEAEIAGRALDRFAETKVAHGALAVGLADAVLGRRRVPPGDYGPDRNRA